MKKEMIDAKRKSNTRALLPQKSKYGGDFMQGLIALISGTKETGIPKLFHQSGDSSALNQCLILYYLIISGNVEVKTYGDSLSSK